MRTGTIVTVCMLLFSCALAHGQKLNSKNYRKKMNPPGTIAVDWNFYCDQTEITNFNWLEYMFWTQRVFGEDSKKFKATLPDSLVWFERKCVKQYTAFYLRHPKYRDYPVVGITREQATAFSEWRSDRVLEVMLIRAGVLPHNPKQDSTNYFTARKWAEQGKNGHAQAVKFPYYIRYRLPDLKDRTRMIQYRDSLKKHDKAYQKNQGPAEVVAYLNELQIATEPCKLDSLYQEPMRKVRPGFRKKDHYLYNLEGNVSEWLSDEKLPPIGSNWTTGLVKNPHQMKPRPNGVNYCTGFRNVCSWEKLW